MKRVNLIILILILITGLSCLIFIEPVRSAIQSAMSVFRISNIDAVSLSLEDIEQMNKLLQEKSGSINMSNIINIKRTAAAKKTITVDKADSNVGFKVQYPEIFKDKIPVVVFTDKITTRMSLNIYYMNSFLKSFDSKEFFPTSLNRKEFVLIMPPVLSLTYNIGSRYYYIEETKVPILNVPEGVDVNIFHNILSNFPLFPETLRLQLQNAMDWQGKTFLPDIDKRMKRVDINGVNGYITQPVLYDGAEAEYIILAWCRDEIMYTISCNTNEIELLTLAQSMK